MRAILKLSAVVLLGVAIQWGLTRGAGALDERAFECRVLVAITLGTPVDDPALIEAAEALMRRQYARHDARYSRPVVRALEVADL